MMYLNVTDRMHQLYNDFLVAFLYTRQSRSEHKEGFAPSESNFFPFRVDPFRGNKLFAYRVDSFSEGDKTILTELSPLKAYPFHLNAHGIF